MLDRPPAPPSAATHSALQTWRGQWRVALRLARRDAWRAKGRSILVLLIVGLPVAVVTFGVVAGLVSQDVNKPLGRMLGSLPAGAEGRLVAAAPGVTQTLAGDGWGVDGIGTTVSRAELAAALPSGTRLVPFGISSGTVILSAGEWAVPTSITVADTNPAFDTGETRLFTGRLPASPTEIALGPDEARKLRVAAGDAVQVGGVGTRKDDVVTFEVVGLVDGPSLVLPGAALPSELLPEQQWYVDSPRPLLWADVRAVNAAGGVLGSRAVALDPPVFCNQFQTCLDSGPAPGEEFNPTVGGVDPRDGALLAAVSVLVVLQVALLAGPAFAVQLRRRQRELGLVGASGGDAVQLRRTVLASGVVLGTVASLGGLAVGWFAVWFFTGLSPWHAIVPEAYGMVVPPLPPIVLGVALVGIVAAAAAALVPALAAAKGDVVDSLKGRRPLPPIRSRRPLLGLVVGLAGLALMAYGVVRLDSVVVVLGIIAGELGVVLVMPWLVARTAALARLLPLGARIAVRDAGRHRMRTTAAACAIAAAAAAGVGATAWSASLSYGAQFSDVAVAPGVTAVTDDGGGYITYDGLGVAQSATQPAKDNIPGVLDAVLAADPSARTAVLRPVVAAAGYDPQTGEGQVLCGPDPASIAFGPDAPPVPCQGRMVAGLLSSYRVVVVDPAAVDLVLGPAAPVDEARRALERGDAVVLQPRTVSDGSAQLSVLGAPSADGTPPPATELTVPAVEVLVGAVPADVLVGPAFLQRPEVRGVLAEGTRGGAVLATGSAPDTADRPGFQDRVGVELVRGDVPAYVFVDSQPTDPLVAFAAVAAGATLLMALLAGLMVTALALADGRSDLATLAAVGAPPRIRRRMAASSAGYVALLGCVVGAVSGLVGSRLLLPLAEPRGTWQTPWLVVVLIVLAVPVLTAGAAWVTTRSRVVLTRRLDS